MSKQHIYKLTAFPKEISLRDGTKITFKPMVAADESELLAFFKRVSPEDRYYLKEDVTNPSVIKRWVQELDYDRALPILAWASGRIVGDGTLHRTRSSARRHVAEIRIIVDPIYRQKGLGTLMLHELAGVANANGIERVKIEAVAEKEEQAIKAAEYVGFVRAGLLPGHAKDMDGRLRDIVILEMPMGKWFEWWQF
jgi:L-amino acid N-acyltransferase YncA